MDHMISLSEVQEKRLKVLMEKSEYTLNDVINAGIEILMSRSTKMPLSNLMRFIKDHCIVDDSLALPVAHFRRAVNMNHKRRRSQKEICVDMAMLGYKQCRRTIGYTQTRCWLGLSLKQPLEG